MKRKAKKLPGPTADPSGEPSGDTGDNGLAAAGLAAAETGELQPAGSMSVDNQPAPQPQPGEEIITPALASLIANIVRGELARKEGASTSTSTPPINAPTSTPPIPPSTLVEDAQRAKSIINEALHVVGTYPGGLGGSTSLAPFANRLDLKAIDKSLKWKGFHDARKPTLFLNQLGDQQVAARAFNDEDKWAVARYLMDSAPYELLTNHAPALGLNPPFSAFSTWFLTTFETKSLTARNWECLQALARAASATDAYKLNMNELMADFEAELARLVGVVLPDLQKIYLFHQRIPAWVHKVTIIDPITKDMFNSWPAYRTNLLSFAASMRSVPASAPQPQAQRTRHSYNPRPGPKLNAVVMKRRAAKPAATSPSTYAAAAAAPSTSTPGMFNAAGAPVSADPRDRHDFLVWYKNTKLHRYLDFQCLDPACSRRGGCPEKRPLTPELRALHAGEWQQAKGPWLAGRPRN